jgi:SAM-dependent methyltransferase
MLPEEARWLGRELAGIDDASLFPMLNVGSSTGAFVTSEQPWIFEHVFSPLERRGGKIVSVDVKRAPGVDIVGDLTDPEVIARLGAMHFRSILCSNLLEHVADREKVARALVSILETGGSIVVSGPRRYPFHPDPIDTLYRPTVSELAALFPRCELVRGEIVNAGNYWRYVSRTPRKLVRATVRLFLPFYRPREWYAALLRLGWLARDFEVVCVVLRK